MNLGRADEALDILKTGMKITSDPQLGIMLDALLENSAVINHH